MSTNKLIEKIIEDARNQETALVDKANAESSKISSDNEKKVSEMLNKNKEKAQIEGNLQKERRIQGAILKVRNDKLAAKQEIIAKTFDEALNQLNGLSDEDFVEFFKNTLAASSFTGEGEVVVNSKRHDLVTSELLKEINEKLESNLTLASADDNVEDGFVVVQNNVHYNFTFKAILESMRSGLVSEVSKELF